MSFVYTENNLKGHLHQIDWSTLTKPTYLLLKGDLSYFCCYFVLLTRKYFYFLKFKSSSSHSTHTNQHKYNIYITSKVGIISYIICCVICHNLPYKGGGTPKHSLALVTTRGCLPLCYATHINMDSSFQFIISGRCKMHKEK